MEQVEIKAWKRVAFGKGASGRLRREGFVPAVLYGPGIDKNVCLKLGIKDIEKILHSHAGTNVLITLDVEGGKPMTVILKSVEREPVRDILDHLDFMHVLKDRKITVEVPVVITGKAEGIASGGILQQEARKLRVECLPHDIPNIIEVDVTALHIGQSLHVKDILLKEGLRILDDEKLTVVLVSAPMVEVVAKTAEQIEAELKESFEEKEKPEEKETEEKKKEKEK